MGLKKFFKRNNEDNSGIEKKGISKLLDKEGFYIIMFLCVCIVGVTAVWVAKSNIDRIAEEDVPNDYEINISDSEMIDRAENEIDSDPQDIIVIDQDDAVENEPNGLSLANETYDESSNQQTPDPNESIENKKGKTLVEKPNPKPQVTAKPKDTIAKTSEEEINETEAVEASAEEIIAMIWPTQGEIGMDYAVETLTYSKTLEHYTTHHGIDILAEENTPVKAALAGEIIEILTDSRLGLTISIKHDDELVTRYSNLCTDAMVNIGDKVTQGQTISGVGKSSIFESAEEPHLHFEVLLNGESVDPMEYLAQE